MIQRYSIITRSKLLTFHDAEATLLVSLAHGNTKLTIVNKIIESNAALIISNFVKESKTI